MGAYDDGLDVLGGFNDTTVFGALREWDNHNAYDKDDVVYYSNQYWRAVRPIDPPLIPAFMSGEVPGDSDAWRVTAAPAILGHGGHGGHGHGGGFRTGGGWWGGGWDDYDGPNIYLVDEDDDDEPHFRRADILGMIDIGAKQLEMNKLKQVPVSIARILLRYGQQAINAARTVADARDLPGGTPRDNVYWKLQWHQDELAKATSPNDMYASGDDLKKWVMQAWIEGNAVEEGSAQLDAMWSQMWSEIGQAIAALPALIAKKVTEVAEEVAWYAKVTTWVVVGAVGLLGYGVYKILSGPTGAALVKRLP